MDAMIHGLNAAQKEAVTRPPGPLMILAAAGTGKTRVITYRIAHLIRQGCPQDRVLAVTFTNKAAREMRERATSLLRELGHAPASGGSDGDAPAPLIGTFHSICVRILRSDIDRIGYPKSFIIANGKDQESVARQVLRTARIDPQDLTHDAFLSHVGRWKTAGRRSDDVAGILDSGSPKEREARNVYPAYEKALRSKGLVDFDDILLCTHELFLHHPDVLEKHRRRWDHVLVDEYQDTNAIQYQLLKLLAFEHRSLCVVGDDDQSIYGWRGAEVGNFKSMERDFPGTHIVRLEENYRSCPRILELANRIIKLNSGRYPKQLRSTRTAVNEPRFRKFPDEEQEAQGVVTDMLRCASFNKLRWRDFAILFRTNEQPRLFEQALRARAIPYTLIGGYSFFDRREIRDILSYLRVAANPADEAALERILNVPARGLGDGAKKELVSIAARRAEFVANMLGDLAHDPSLSPQWRSGLAELDLILTEFRENAQKHLVSATQKLLDRIGYQAHLARVYPEAKDRLERWESVKELVNMVAQFAQRHPGTLQDFLDSVTLASQEDRKDRSEERDAVILITLHAAKGLEFPQVYMVGMEEGILPHERSIGTSAGLEEERRLAYVGITRARDQLTLTRAEKRMKFGKPKMTRPSQFLAEMFGKPPSLCLEKESGQTGFGAQDTPPIPSAFSR